MNKENLAFLQNALRIEAQHLASAKGGFLEALNTLMKLKMEHLYKHEVGKVYLRDVFTDDNLDRHGLQSLKCIGFYERPLGMYENFAEFDITTLTKTIVGVYMFDPKYIRKHERVNKKQKAVLQALDYYYYSTPDLNFCGEKTALFSRIEELEVLGYKWPVVTEVQFDYTFDALTGEHFIDGKLTLLP
jgi:hypothetical protein